MNIGVDVDGVLLEIESYQLEHGARYFKKKYGRDIINPNGFDIKDIFDCTDKERMSFWVRHIWKQTIFRPARGNAANVLRKLHDEGFGIYIITSRVYTTHNNLLGRLFRKILKDWLRRNKIVYDDIYYCSESNSEKDKVIGCEKYKIAVMIEDNAKNVNAIAEKTKVLCFDAAYNRGCVGENIIRVNSFEQIYKILRGEKK